MNEERVTKIAEAITASNGLYYYVHRNGVVVWSTQGASRTSKLLDKVDESVLPTESYRWTKKIQTSEGPADVWTWYGLFGTTREVTKALEKLGFVEQKPVKEASKRVAVGSPFMVMKTLQLKREGATRDSLENARRIQEAGYILIGGTFEFDTTMAEWSTHAIFEWGVDGSTVKYTFKGFSFGYGGEGPRGLIEFFEIFSWPVDKGKVLQNTFGIDKGKVPLRAFR